MSDPQEELKRWFHEKTAPHGIKARLSEVSGYSATQISRMRNIETDDPKKRQEIPVDMIAKAARFFNELPPGFEGMTNWLDGEQPRENVRFVPIVGKAGAGPDGTVLFATGDRNFGEIEAPLDAAPSARALEVQGNSMYGVANDGWIIFFEDKEAPSPDHMGELCVCFLEDERVLVKIPYPGSQRGLYNLDSANAPPMRDIPVRAFAIVTDIKTRRAAQRFIRRNPDHQIDDLKIA